MILGVQIIFFKEQGRYPTLQHLTHISKHCITQLNSQIQKCNKILWKYYNLFPWQHIDALIEVTEYKTSQGKDGHLLDF